MTKKKEKQVLLKDHSGGGGAGRIKVLIRFVLNSVISKRALLTGDMQFPVFKLLYSGILGFIERNLISGMHWGLCLFLVIIIYIIYLDLNLVAIVFQIDASLTLDETSNLARLSLVL